MKVFIGRYPRNDGDRTIRVRIDPQDIWSLDHTLALIIHPALKVLREDEHGAPLVDNADVPKCLHRNDEEADPGDDEHWFARWRWVLDEMIWTFNAIVTEWDDIEPFNQKKYKAREARIDNGLRLFGKYYRGLWT